MQWSSSALASSEVAEKGHCRPRQGLTGKAVENATTDTTVGYQVGLLEDREMAGNRRLGALEVADDLAHGVLSDLEEVENPTASFGGQGEKEPGEIGTRRQSGGGLCFQVDLWRGGSRPTPRERCQNLLCALAAERAQGQSEVVGDKARWLGGSHDSQSVGQRCQDAVSEHLCIRL